MSNKYRKKPVIIEAVQWDGNNIDRILSFIETVAAYQTNFGTIEITTLEGTLTVPMGDWVIKGVKGEFYICERDGFNINYEKASDTQVISDREIEWME